MDVLLDLFGGADLRRDLDAQRVAEEAFGKLADLARHGGGEQHRLPRRAGRAATIVADVADEAEVEHAVGLVEHEMRDLIEQQVACVSIRSRMRPGVPTTMSGPRRMRSSCGRRPTPPRMTQVEDRLAVGEAADGGVDLQRQFPRRRQDQARGCGTGRARPRAAARC